MGRVAAGNKGITLRKGDYVVGAAVTDSPDARDAKRNERAKERNLEQKLVSVREKIEEAENKLRTARESLRAGLVFLEDKKKVKKRPKSQIFVSNATPRSNCGRGLTAELGLSPCLILSVTDNGYGKRTDADDYRLTSRGGSGVINMKTTSKIGKVSSINLVDETSELMVISQFGKIIRIDTKSIRAAGRSHHGRKAPRPGTAG